MIANPTPGSGGAIEVTLDDDTEYLTMGRKAIEWQFVVRAFVGSSVDEGAQKRLDALMESDGATSVRAALESDSTLGGVAQDVTVSALRGPRIYQRAGGPALLGCEWVVDVIAAGA